MNALDLKDLCKGLTPGPYILGCDVENLNRDKRMKYGRWSEVIPVAKKGELFVVDIYSAGPGISRGASGGSCELLTSHSSDFVKAVAVALVRSDDPWHRVLARTASTGCPMHSIGDDVVERLLRTGVVTEEQINAAVDAVMSDLNS